MKRAPPAALALLLAAQPLLAGTAAAQQTPMPTYRLDPQHTFVHFEVLHFGTSTSRGRFGPIDGTVEFDRARRSGRVSLRIPVGSVDTGLAIFDARLKREDLLAAETFPYAFFVASDFRFDGDRLAEVRGELTLRGTAQPLVLRVLRFGCRAGDARVREVCGGDFVGEVSRSGFGAGFGVPLIDDRVRLVLQVEASAS